MRKAIPRIKEFPDNGRIWRVDWFGGVERNPQVPSEPKIQLIISPVVDGETITLPATPSITKNHT